MDQPLTDTAPPVVILGRAMRGFSQQDVAGLADAINKPIKIVQAVKRQPEAVPRDSTATDCRPTAR